MLVFFVFTMLLLAGVYFLWSVISPRSVWENLYTWAFKNPEAVEPSDRAFEVWRVVAGICLLGLIILAIVIGVNRPEWLRTRDEIRYEHEVAEYEECLNEYEGHPSVPAEELCEWMSPAPR